MKAKPNSANAEGVFEPWAAMDYWDNIDTGDEV
jgi:hypothetical protein